MIKILIILLFSISSFAFTVPNNAVIKVYNSSGKLIGQMKRSEYKVVKLGSSTKSKSLIKKKVKRITVKDLPKHKTLILHAGTGNNGVRVIHKNGQYVVKEKQDHVFGATGCLSKQGKGLCATVQSNETIQVGLKIDFN